MTQEEVNLTSLASCAFDAAPKQHRISAMEAANEFAENSCESVYEMVKTESDLETVLRMCHSIHACLRINDILSTALGALVSKEETSLQIARVSECICEVFVRACGINVTRKRKDDWIVRMIQRVVESSCPVDVLTTIARTTESARFVPALVLSHTLSSTESVSTDLLELFVTQCFSKPVPPPSAVLRQLLPHLASNMTQSQFETSIAPVLVTKLKRQPETYLEPCVEVLTSLAATTHEQTWSVDPELCRQWITVAWKQMKSVKESMRNLSSELVVALCRLSPCLRINDILSTALGALVSKKENSIQITRVAECICEVFVRACGINVTRKRKEKEDWIVRMIQMVVESSCPVDVLTTIARTIESARFVPALVLAHTLSTESCVSTDLLELFVTQCFSKPVPPPSAVLRQLLTDLLELFVTQCFSKPVPPPSAVLRQLLPHLVTNVTQSQFETSIAPVLVTKLKRQPETYLEPCVEVLTSLAASTHEHAWSVEPELCRQWISVAWKQMKSVKESMRNLSSELVVALCRLSPSAIATVVSELGTVMNGLRHPDHRIVAYRMLTLIAPTEDVDVVEVSVTDEALRLLAGALGKEPDAEAKVVGMEGVCAWLALFLRIRASSTPSKGYQAILTLLSLLVGDKKKMVEFRGLWCRVVRHLSFWSVIQQKLTGGDDGDGDGNELVVELVRDVCQHHPKFQMQLMGVVEAATKKYAGFNSGIAAAGSSAVLDVGVVEAATKKYAGFNSGIAAASSSAVLDGLLAVHLLTLHSNPTKLPEKLIPVVSKSGSFVYDAVLIQHTEDPVLPFLPSLLTYAVTNGLISCEKVRKALLSCVLHSTNPTARSAGMKCLTRILKHDATTTLPQSLLTALFTVLDARCQQHENHLSSQQLTKAQREAYEPTNLTPPTSTAAVRMTTLPYNCVRDVAVQLSRCSRTGDGVNVGKLLVLTHVGLSGSTGGKQSQSAQSFAAAQISNAASDSIDATATLAKIAVQEPATSHAVHRAALSAISNVAKLAASQMFAEEDEDEEEKEEEKEVPSVSPLVAAYAVTNGLISCEKVRKALLSCVLHSTNPTTRSAGMKCLTRILKYGDATTLPQSLLTALFTVVDARCQQHENHVSSQQLTKAQREAYEPTNLTPNPSTSTVRMTTVPYNCVRDVAVQLSRQMGDGGVNLGKLLVLTHVGLSGSTGGKQS
eukprot:CAMPEP_0194397018 /NCGR_PEP_ID=MMETSP0174-20130528/125312_1 /TAXON_ID=216777 /ORGANISM="Proboscia alata, Strain PI-D3" /LENGTH=1185 /DNA_ID=CAMNT_0039193151 /DNA_START=121 /DNA_END=3676 /DNA_ORIENTATION=+